MTASELAELEAFYALEPFGPKVDDFRFAQLCAVMSKPYAKKGKAPKPSDFMHDDRDLTPIPTEQMKAKLMAAFGIK